MKINNIITAVALTTTVIAGVFALNAQATIKDQAEYIDFLGDVVSETEVDYEAYELQQAENLELRVSADNLMNELCRVEAQVQVNYTRPMCEEPEETRHWTLVVDEQYSYDGTILTAEEILEAE